MDDLDSMIERADAIIAANRTILQAVNRAERQREYELLSYEKQTGQPLL